MNIIAIIPARCGSKGIPFKNIKNFNGKPLISWTIAAALNANLFSDIFVSTDCLQIKDISVNLGAKVPFLRPKYLAKDTSSTLNVIQHFLKKFYKNKNLPDLVFILQPTSPLRTSDHITEAFNEFILDLDADSLVSCLNLPHNFVPNSLMKVNSKGYLYNYEKSSIISRRQDKESLIARNGAAIYITKPSIIRYSILGGNIKPFFMKFVDSIDIDDENDWELAEILAKNKVYGIQ